MVGLDARLARRNAGSHDPSHAREDNMTLDDWKKVAVEDDKRVLDLAIAMAANAGGTYAAPVFDTQDVRAFMLACDQRATHRACARNQERQERQAP
jgi:hypothetical protein